MSSTDREVLLGRIEQLHRSRDHTFAKARETTLALIAGLGVDGDAHQGAAVQHRSRVAVDASQPNLRQVHLIAAELYDELRQRGFSVVPGQMGENITTRGLDLCDLPTGTILRLGGRVLVALTGLRNPCQQLDQFESGLMAAVLDRDEAGHLVRRAGVMAVVVHGGAVAVDDEISVSFPPGPPIPLGPV
jgi:hypothetical protein